MASFFKALSLVSLLTTLTNASPHALGVSSNVNHARQAQELSTVKEVLDVSSTTKPEQGYLVEFEDDKAYEQGFLDAIGAAVGVNVSLVTDLTGGVLFNGVSIRIGAHDVALDAATKIAALPGVVSVFENQPMTIPQININATSSFPGMEQNGTVSRTRFKRDAAAAAAAVFNSNDQIMTQIDLIRAKGITGKGIKVAIMEGEADASHPALNIAFTRDYRTPEYLANPNPDPQCKSHPTATIGLIGALPGKSPSGYQGYAPGVTLGNYILSGCDGRSILADPVISAMEDVIKDGTNIVSISIEWGDRDWKWLEGTRLLEKAAARGVLIVIAGSDDNGLFRGSSSCAAAGVFCVNNVMNTVWPIWGQTAKYKVDNGTTGEIGVRVDERIGTGFAGVNLPVWSNLAPNAGGWYDHGGSGCVDLPTTGVPDLSKYIVLIRRDICNEDDMIDRIERAGGKYLLIGEIYDSPDYDIPFRPDIGRSHPNLIALGTVSGTMAVELVKAQRAGRQVTLNLNDMHLRLFEQVKPSGDGGLVAYSGWGPTHEGAMVTDMVAPGFDIPILQPLALGGWSAASGSSLATPIVAAIGALVGEALGTKDPAVIAAVLSSSAKPLPGKEVGQGYAGKDLDSPLHQGAGMVQADRAVSVPAVVSVPNFEFNDTLHRTKEQFTITNLRSQPLTYELSNLASPSLYTFEEGWLAPVGNSDTIRDKQRIPNAATLSFSPGNRITIPPKGKATVEVSATDPTGVDLKRIPIFSGWVLLKATDGSNLTIPYVGFAGDIDRAPKVHLIEVDKTSVNFSNEDITFTIWHGLDSYEHTLQIIDAATKKQVGPDIWGPYTRSNSGFTYWWVGEWDGFKWPAGQYQLRARSLSAFATPRSTNEADYVYTDGPTFTVSWSS